MLYVGITAYVLFFWLGCIEQIEPFYHYYFFFAWIPFLFIINQLHWRIHGRAVCQSFAELAGLLLFSITVWSLFEGVNFRLHDWSYIGSPTVPWMRWAFSALSFSTVVPAIFWMSQLFDNSIESRSPSPFSLPLFGFGALLLLLQLIWPQLFFPLIWEGFFFLFEPIVQALGGHSLIQDWKEGRWGKTRALLFSGILCGLFWEFSNYWAGAKWIYHLPYWNSYKIFEMPLIGYLGYLPFALSLFVMYQAIKKLWERLATRGRSILILMAMVFCFFIIINI